MDQLIHREFINPDILQKGTPYYVQLVEKIVTEDEPDFIARLWFKGNQDVWVVLPQHFTYHIDENLLSLLNSRRYVFDLVYYGRTQSGTPIF
jgi:hypothetical protein